MKSMLILSIVTILTALPSISGQFLITFHGGSNGINNIEKYTLSGTLSGPLLSNSDGIHGLRGLIYIPASSSLLFLQAYQTNSTLLLTSNCGRTTSSVSQKNLAHPYGIAIDPVRKIAYVSNQDSNNVVSFPLSNPTSITQFVSVPNPRGVAVDSSGNLYAASEDLNAVLVFSSAGAKKGTISIDTPIGVYVNGSVLYVSSKSNKNPGVYSYDVTSLKHLLTYVTPDNHPTGILTTGGSLYVLGQQNGKLYRFRQSDASYIGVVISSFPDTPEHIILSQC